jgi:hypothetical protein
VQFLGEEKRFHTAWTVTGRKPALRSGGFGWFHGKTGLTFAAGLNFVAQRRQHRKPMPKGV